MSQEWVFAHIGRIAITFGLVVLIGSIVVGPAFLILITVGMVARVIYDVFDERRRWRLRR